MFTEPPPSASPRRNGASTDPAFATIPWINVDGTKLTPSETKLIWIGGDGALHSALSSMRMMLDSDPIAPRLTMLYGMNAIELRPGSRFTPPPPREIVVVEMKPSGPPSPARTGHGGNVKRRRDAACVRVRAAHEIVAGNLARVVTDRQHGGVVRDAVGPPLNALDLRVENDDRDEPRHAVDDLEVVGAVDLQAVDARVVEDNFERCVDAEVRALADRLDDAILGGRSRRREQGATERCEDEESRVTFLPASPFLSSRRRPS